MKNVLKRMVVFLLICAMFFTSSGFTNLAYATSISDVDENEQTQQQEEQEAEEEKEQQEPQPQVQENAQNSTVELMEPTSNYLKIFTKAVKIEGAAYDQNTDTYKVDPDKEYVIHILFQEKGQGQVQFDHSQMIYHFPEGIQLSKDQNGNIAALEDGMVVNDNTYHVQDNTLVFDWNKADPNYKHAVASAQTQLVFSLKGKFNPGIRSIDFGEDVKVKVNAMQKAEAAEETTEAKEEDKVKEVSKFEYEDSKVSVTATLQNGETLPATTKLVVKEINENTATYQNAEKKIEEYAKKNDIAFEDYIMYDIKLVKDGVEVEPDASVKVTIDYKRGMKEFDGATEDTVSVLHLNESKGAAFVEDVTKDVDVSPTGAVESVEMVTDSFSTFVIANQSTESINVTVNAPDGTYYVYAAYESSWGRTNVGEPQTVNVTGGSGQINNWNIYSDKEREVFLTINTERKIGAKDGEAFKGSEHIYSVTETADGKNHTFTVTEKTITPGALNTFEDALGESVVYGIVANTAAFKGHLESNFAIGDLYNEAANVDMSKNASGGAGVNYIGALRNRSLILGLNGNKSGSLAYLGAEYDGAKLTANGDIVINRSKSESAIKSYVSHLVNQASAKSAELYQEGQKHGYKSSDLIFEGDGQKYYLDLTSYAEGNGTYYINLEKGDMAKYFDQASRLIIKLREGQNVVFNIPDEDVTFCQYKLIYTSKSGTVKEYTTNGNADEDIVAQSVIFNCPNAKTARTRGSACTGTFLIPNGDYANDNVAAGWIVADTLSKMGGHEWHNVFHDMPEYTSYIIEARKTVNGKVPSSTQRGKFTFKLYQIAEDGSETLVDTKTNGLAGQITFDQIGHVSKTGTYWYKITEEGQVEGFTIDSTIYYAKVDVTEIKGGKLTANVTYHTDSKTGTTVELPVFNNTNGGDSTSVQLKAKKVLTGRDLVDNEFEFTLSEGRKVIQTVKNKGQEVNFQSITYTAEGTHEYTIKETVGSASGVTYSTATYKAIVTVTTDGDDKLVASVKYYDKDDKEVKAADVVFTNTYKALETKAQLKAKKVLTVPEGSTRQLKDNEFEFTLSKDGKEIETVKNKGQAVEFSELTFKEAGTYEYKIVEKAGKLGGVSYSKAEYKAVVTVEEKDGKLEARVNYYDKDNKEVKEANVVFENTYTAHGDVVLDAQKNFVDLAETGKTLGIYNFKLTEMVKAEDGSYSPKEDGVERTATNDTDGKVTFEKIDYPSLASVGTYYYQIEETVTEKETGYIYDGTKYIVKVTVEDKKAGKLTATKEVVGADAVVFTNKYDETSTTVDGTKTFEGGDLSKTSFTFKLYDKDGKVAGSATTDSQGAFSINTPTYYKEAELTYTLKEDMPEAANEGNHYTVNGITYDPTVYTVDVTVSKNAEGKLTAKAEVNNGPAAFTNKYEATGSWNPEAKKVLHVDKTKYTRELKEGDFSFTITEVKDAQGTALEGQAYTETVSNDANGKVAFSTINYEAAGTHYYKVVENAGQLGGVDYDKKEVIITVTVVDNKDGSLTTTADKTIDALTFDNTYTAKAAKAQLQAKKVLTVPEGATRQLKDNEFEFTLSGKDGEIETVGNKGQAVTFTELSYNAAGTYEYTIVEKAGDLKDKGITYSTVTYKAVVTVTDNEEGKLVAAVKYYLGDEEVEAADVVFENTYTLEDAKAQLKAKKVLDGRNLKDNEFTFTLSDKTGEVDTVTNKGQEVNFKELTYKAAGTYEYTISEVHGQLGGITYDATVYKAVVVVTDNGEGKLVAAKPVYYLNDVEVAEANVVFNNKYESQKTNAVLKANKVLTGRDLIDGEFTFTLSDASGEIQTVTNLGTEVTFNSIEYTTVGEYTYIIAEKNEGKGGVTYSQATFTAVVTITDDGKGNLVSAVQYKDADGNNIDAAAVVFENAYAAHGEWTPEAKKVLAGRDLKEGEFSFTITATDAEGNALKDKEGKVVYAKTATNKVDGTVTFETIEYTKAGTHYYTVKENAGKLGGVTYDNKSVIITVTVVDNGDGTLTASADRNIAELTFKNTYAAEGNWVPKAKKVLVGRDLKDDEFSFTLTATDAEGKALTGKAAYTETVRNTADGKVVFTAIPYTKAGTYYYNVKENAEKLGGVTYDNKEVLITVTVVDNEDGTLTATPNRNIADLTFKNTYKADETTAQLKAKKVLTVPAGATRQLKDNEFEFILSGKDGEIETVGNKGQAVTFAELTYKKAGTYEYTIVEKAGDLEDKGITYSTVEYKAVVTVTDDGEGKLHATVKYYLDDKEVEEANVVFENTYTVEDAKAQLKAKKVLTIPAGATRQLKDNEFKFILSGKDGEIETVGNKGQAVTFTELSYNAVGTYEYTIVEKAGDLKGITYSTVEYKAVVTVTDNDEGALVADVKYYLGDEEVDEANIEFENTYTVADAKAQLNAKKALKGRNLKDNEFTFTLSDANGEVDSTTNQGQAVSFKELTYDAAGTYEYTISEVPNGLGGMTYDATVYKAVVTVTDNDEGALVADVKYYGYNKETESYDIEVKAADVVFNNEYNSEKTNAVIKAKKALTVPEGATRQLKDNEFTFTLSDDKGQIDEVTNTGSEVTFPSMEYTKAGEYTYTIAEKAGDKKYITYSTVTYKAVVSVTDDGKGQLHADVKYYDKDNKEVAAADVVFENTYTVTDAKAQLQAKKVLTVPEGATRQLKDNEFEFTLSDKDGEIETVGNKGQAVIFTELSYNAAGTYEYTIVEKVGDLEEKGITYSTVTYKAVVTVTDNDEGKLVAAVKYYDKDGKEVKAADVVFENTYTVTDAKAQLKAKKVLRVPEGATRQLKAGEFEFTLSDAEGVIKTVKNTGDKGEEVIFPELSYNKADTYEYTIAEKVGDLKGITYSTVTYKAVVTVTDNDEGKLVAAVKYYLGDKEVDEANVEFENTYTVTDAKAQLKAKKVLRVPEGATRQLKAGEFEFTLSDAEGVIKTVKNTGDKGEEVIFPELSYNKADTYEYTIAEKVGDLKGITYSTVTYKAVVTVTDNDEGKLVAAVKYYDKDDKEVDEANVEFENTYTVTDAKAQLKAKKVLRVPEGATRQLKAGEFEFTLSDAEGVIKTVKNTGDKGEEVIFPELSYNKADTYEYTIAEKVGDLKGITYSTVTYKAVVTVTDNDEGKLVAAEKYYDKDGKEVDAADVEFENIYTVADAKVELKAKKVLRVPAGATRQLKAGEFEFTLSDAEGVIKTVKNTGDKGEEVIFPELSYNKADTYEYTIAEKVGDLKGITYSTVEYKAVVTVIDDGEGKFVADVKYYLGDEEVDEANVEFENTYTVTDAKANLKAKKALTVAEGATRQLKAGEFEFTLSDVNDVIETVKNTGDKGEEVNFSELTYKAVGTYEYTICEVPGELGGIKYDATVYKAVVTVTDNDEGQLVADVKYYSYNKETDAYDIEVKAADVVFNNEYNAKETNAILKASKDLQGRKLEDGEFTFTLSDKDGKEIEEVKNVGSEVTFTAIEYKKVGTYEYIIKEAKGELGGMTYSEATFKAVVTVTDNKAGELVSAVKYYDADDKEVDAAKVVFVNTYKAEGSIELEAKKVLTGRDTPLEANEFSFTMIEVEDAKGTAKEGAKPVTVKNDADGKVAFGKLTYTQDDINKKHYYKVTEESGKEDFMKYDTKEVIVTVSIEDNKDGTLKVTSDKQISDLTFTNTFESDAQITVTKNVTVEGKKANKKSGSFYVALFSDKECKEMVPGRLLEIAFHGSSSESVTFENLEYGTYYVAETDAEGKALPKKYSPAAEIIVTIKQDKDSVEITKETKTGKVDITNDYDAPEEDLKVAKDIEITKTVTKNGVKQTGDLGSFYFAIFDNELLIDRLTVVSDLEGNPVEIGNDGILELNYANGYKNGAYDMALEDGTYYVAEVDKNGNLVDEVSDFPYTVYFDGNEFPSSSNGYYLDDAHPSAKAEVVNDKSDKPTTEHTSEGTTGYTHGGGGGGSYTTSSTSAKTGDDNALGLYLILLLAGLALGGFGFGRKRRED